MPDPESLPDFLLRFGLAPFHQQVIPVGSAGGFSGARLWRIVTDQQEYCLRRWPAEHPSRERLQYIHAVLQQVAATGFDLVPEPLIDRDGQSIFEAEGRLWELSRWLPGIADFAASPTPARLAAALTALARFHVAAASGSTVKPALSPGLVDRHRQLVGLGRGGISRLRKSIRPGDWPELYSLAKAFLQRLPMAIQRVAPRVAAAATRPVTLQPCIRDIWHDHVLFTGERVTGIVDFGALRDDSVATDLARLIGSLVGDDLYRRHAALEAYSHVHPLGREERQLVDVFDSSAVILGGVNWLSWIYLENRDFPDRSRVISRFSNHLERLCHLLRR